MQNSSSSKITSAGEFAAFLVSLQFRDNPLARLSTDDLAFFAGQLKFSDTGFPGGYWGDVARNEKMSDAELAEFVAHTFGADKDEFEKCLHWFGTMDGTCTKRPHYNCPYC
jgi:hypothetical protein